MIHQIGFKYALQGIKYAFFTQPNFKVHSLFALLALLLAWWLHLNQLEWLVLLLTISLVIVTEMINTAIESMTDLIEEKYHQKAKIAKDVSAGMVLLASTLSVIIGLILFIPKI